MEPVQTQLEGSEGETVRVCGIGRTKLVADNDVAAGKPLQTDPANDSRRLAETEQCDWLPATVNDKMGEASSDHDPVPTQLRVDKARLEPVALEEDPDRTRRREADSEKTGCHACDPEVPALVKVKIKVSSSDRTRADRQCSDLEEKDDQEDDRTPADVWARDTHVIE